MHSIQEIEQAFLGLDKAIESRWRLRTLIPERLHLSQDHIGQWTIFLEGNVETFGRLPLLNGLEHRADAQDAASGRVFGALRISASGGDNGNTAMAHIAFEFERRLSASPPPDNLTQLSSVDWILRLLGREMGLLDESRQHGLVAECLLLQRLLQVAREEGISAQTVLERWWGPTGGKRDFAAAGIAIEVKSTALNSRRHHISSIDQLEPLSPGELVFLYSVGVKSEPTYERTLATYLADVEQAIVDHSGSPDVVARNSFRVKAVSAGYDFSLEGLYRSQPGLLPNQAMPPHLYKVDDLERLRIGSFKNDRLPSMVSSVAYDLEISARPLNEAESRMVLVKLISGAPPA